MTNMLLFSSPILFGFSFLPLCSVFLFPFNSADYAFNDKKASQQRRSNRFIGQSPRDFFFGDRFPLRRRFYFPSEDAEFGYHPSLPSSVRLSLPDLVSFVLPPSHYLPPHLLHPSSLPSLHSHHLPRLFVLEPKRKGRKWKRRRQNGRDKKSRWKRREEEESGGKVEDAEEDSEEEDKGWYGEKEEEGSEEEKSEEDRGMKKKKGNGRKNRRKNAKKRRNKKEGKEQEEREEEAEIGKKEKTNKRKRDEEEEEDNEEEEKEEHTRKKKRGNEGKGQKGGKKRKKENEEEHEKEEERTKKKRRKNDEESGKKEEGRGRNGKKKKGGKEQTKRKKAAEEEEDRDGNKGLLEGTKNAFGEVMGERVRDVAGKAVNFADPVARQLGPRALQVAGPGLGAAVGTMVGGPMGGMVGRAIGNRAADFVNNNYLGETQQPKTLQEQAVGKAAEMAGNALLKRAKIN